MIHVIVKSYISNIGSINWHGPHHVAQKSTKTILLSDIKCSKLFSDNSIIVLEEEVDPDSLVIFTDNLY